MKTRDQILNLGVICGMSAGGFAASNIPWSPMPKAALVGCISAIVFTVVSRLLRLKRVDQPRV